MEPRHHNLDALLLWTQFLFPFVVIWLSTVTNTFFLWLWNEYSLIFIGYSLTSFLIPFIVMLLWTVNKYISVGYVKSCFETHIHHHKLIRWGTLVPSDPPSLIVRSPRHPGGSGGAVVRPLPPRCCPPVAPGCPRDCLESGSRTRFCKSRADFMKSTAFIMVA